MNTTPIKQKNMRYFDEDDPDGIYQDADLNDPYDYATCQFDW